MREREGGMNETEGVVTERGVREREREGGVRERD